MLAQSQRAVDINSLDRMMAAVQAMAGVKPEILDNIDGDGLFNAYADRLSVDPSVCLSKDKVEKSESKELKLKHRLNSWRMLNRALQWFPIYQLHR